MGGGAVVAAAAAAHKRRLQVVIDAFRLADATAPDRAQSLDALGVVQNAEVDELTRDGVLVPGPDSDTWYLSERAYIDRREARSQRARGMMAILLVVVAILLGLALYLVKANAA
jgi:hypothetical protein